MVATGAGRGLWREELSCRAQKTGTNWDTSWGLANTEPKSRMIRQAYDGGPGRLTNSSTPAAWAGICGLT